MKKLVEIASEVVKAQASMAPMSPAAITSSLQVVFRTLQVMQQSELTSTGLESVEGDGLEAVYSKEMPALLPENSIQNDKVVCLECGAEMRQLTRRHLSSHGISPKEYRKKYGFTMRTPLAAKSLTRARKKAARKRGLPENLAKFMEARRASKAGARADHELSGPGADRLTKVKSRFAPKQVV